MVVNLRCNKLLNAYSKPPNSITPIGGPISQHHRPEAEVRYVAGIGLVMLLFQGVENDTDMTTAVNPSAEVEPPKNEPLLLTYPSDQNHTT